jgi:competence protein ComEA
MSSLGKNCLIAGAALLLIAATANVGLAQLQPQPELLKRLWPFFKQPVRPVAQLSEPVKIAKRSQPLVAPFVPRKIDINSCSLLQLQDLPGVNASMGAHLMAGRPYRTFDDLERDGVPLNVIARLRGVIVFGP